MRRNLLANRGRLGPALENLLLAMFGTAMALSLMEVALRAFPLWVPAGVRVNPPVRRVKSFVDETYDVRLSSGDLFHWMGRAIEPLPVDKDPVVAQVHFRTDENGFRNDEPEYATYPVVAVGDSFTIAGNVATPWPRVLAKVTGNPVLNLGEAGAGPQQELAVLEEYGLGKNPEWVIWAYFEGNDLYDAGAYEQATPFILPRLGRYAVTEALTAWRKARTGDSPTTIAPPAFQYPIAIQAGGTRMELAFFSAYIAWLTASDEMVLASRNFELVSEALQRAHVLTEAAGARLLLLYIPTKAHVYLPLVEDAATLDRIFSDVPTVALEKAGYLSLSAQKATPELVLEHMDVQADVLSQLAMQHEIAFLDLTPVLQAEARIGVQLYYPFDTHWNQTGHDLAGQAVADFLEASSEVGHGTPSE